MSVESESSLPVSLVSVDSVSSTSSFAHVDPSRTSVRTSSSLSVEPSTESSFGRVYGVAEYARCALATNPWIPSPAADGPLRVPGQGALPAVRDPYVGGPPGDVAAGGARRGRGARPRGRRQGAGADRRPWQGGRDQARSVAGRGGAARA